jgi:signal transduction histidine kinase
MSFDRRRWVRHRRRHRQRLRHYFGAHLHRRLFMWFGASIFMTAGIVSALAHVSGGRSAGRGLASLFVAGAMLWLVAGKIARRIARPLSELVHVAEQIGAGRLDTRASVPPWRIGEIAVLARAINDMAARNEQQMADQRELLAGVSHEIRTPLARIRVLLEIGRQSGATAEVIDELEREVIEIDALVGELLASARLDFAALSPRPLDGIEVARRALERAGIPPEALVVGAGASGGQARFDGDPTLVARALANLLDNARRHAGGVELLRVTTRPGFVVFDVEDRGPGFPAQAEGPIEGPPIADASARPEGQPRAERIDGVPRSGTSFLGLGLVLVRRIAHAHRGTLTVGNRAEGGARASIELAAS